MVRIRLIDSGNMLWTGVLFTSHKPVYFIYYTHYVEI